MTNYEHYKEQIEKIVRLGWRIAVTKDGEPHSCSELSCQNCIAEGVDCYQTVSKWADEEYIKPEERVDWSKVPVDTPVLVKVTCDGDWYKRYFAKYQNGCVYTFNNGATSWSCNGNIDSWNFAKLAEVENDND